MPLPQEKLYTLADLLSWEEEVRMELIDGVPIMMATPVRAHQKSVRELFGQLYNYLKGKQCEVYTAPFAVRLFEQEGDRPENVGTVVEPDISVVCSPDKLDDIGCKGAPDFIIEVLSPSTQRHDRLTKFNLYQRAGVREYWIADPANQSVQAFLLEDGRYSIKELGIPGDRLRVSVLEDCVLDLTDVFPNTFS